jgi:pimeloyl-ACP methyl ester carboxylesterase
VRCERLGTVIGLVAAVLVTAVLLGGCGGGKSGREGGGRPEGLVNVRSVHFDSSFDGTRVNGTVAVPRAVTPRGCVIWQYDAGSTKETSAPAWQGLATLGLAGFAIDLRYHGDRASGPTEYRQALREPKKFRELVRGSVEDLRSAIGYLEKQPFCKENVGYVGVGLGGAIGTILAAEDKRVKAVALVSTPGTWRGVSTVPGGDASVDPDRFVGKIAPRRVLILSGNADKVVAPSSARSLQAAAREPKTVVDFRGGHDPAVGPDAVGNAETVFSFLLRTIVEPSYHIDGREAGTFALER